jgi:putative ABC transport system permease protein
VLVGSQFAIATPLLIVAGLLIASLNGLKRVDLGFDSRNIVSGGIQLPPAQYRGPQQVGAFWDELQRRVEKLPGVTGVAFADGRPPNDVNSFNNFDLEDAPTPPGGSQPVTPWVAVSPEYFRLLGLSLVQGRLFDARDGLTSDVLTVIVDRAWAARFFPNTSALGRRFKEGGCTTCPWTTVVGVVSEVKYAGLDKPDQGTVYSPMATIGAAAPERFRYLIARTAGDSSALASSVRQVVRELDPSLPFSDVASIDDLVERSLQRPRSLSILVGVLAAVALVLSIVGIYGVMAYYVQQHAKEISIRMALGGSPAAVLQLVVGQGMTVVAGGLIVGLLTAVGVTRLMSSLLFGVGATDAFTFSSMAILLLAVALVACLLPARRAISVEPAAVLRND